MSNSYWIKVVAIFFMGWILMYATRTIFSPVMGVIEEQFGLSNTQLGLASSIFFLTRAVAQTPFGMIGDKIGRKLVITAGLVVFAIPTYFNGLATTFAMFLVVRAIAGVGQGAYYDPQYAPSTGATPTNKRTIGNVIISSGMAFGTPGGHLFSSKLALENGKHWSKSLFIMAIPTFTVGIFFYTILKEKVIRPGEGAARTVAEEGPQEKTSLKEIFPSRNLLATFILCFTSIYANLITTTWLPQFLIAEHGSIGANVGFISSLVPWVSIPGALIFIRLSGRTGVTKKLVFALVFLAILSVFAIVFVTNRTLLISVLILYGLTGKSALDPIMVTFVTKYAPKAALGTTLGTYSSIGISGLILTPYVTRYSAGAANSMQVDFYLPCVLLVIGLLAFTPLAKGESKPKLG